METEEEILLLCWRVWRESQERRLPCLAPAPMESMETVPRRERWRMGKLWPGRRRWDSTVRMRSGGAMRSRFFLGWMMQLSRGRLETICAIGGYCWRSRRKDNSKERI